MTAGPNKLMLLSITAIRQISAAASAWCLILSFNYFAQADNLAAPKTGTKSVTRKSTVAANDFDAGVASFNKKDYRTALAHFTATLNGDPNNSNALYYEAVCFHRLNELDLAKQAYATVVLRYPNTQAASNAQAALSYLNPGFLKKFQQRVSAAASSNNSESAGNNNSRAAISDSVSNISSLPDEVRIPYRKQGNNLVVTAYINNHPLEMYFDSGAEMTMVYKSQIGNLGLSDPHGKPTGMAYGVGEGGAQTFWVVKTNLKVGQIEHHDFPITIQDDSAHSGVSTYPLLGETFFRGFSYKVLPASDGGEGSIMFEKKRANSSMSVDNASIPYKNLGTDMIVNVTVNGRSVPMIFDTGAETCCFTMHQWVDQMKMNIPDDAMDTHNRGIAGMTRSKHFTIDSMQLGSIIKHDVSVDVIESSAISYPLLGNSFFGDLHIDVDNAAHLIRCRR